MNRKAHKNMTWEVLPPEEVEFNLKSNSKMTKKKPAAKRKVKVAKLAHTYAPIQYHALDLPSSNEQLRERIINLAANTTTQENIGKVGHTPASTKQILDRAEQFYQFVKKK
jgi:hypothetical protein